MAKKNQKLANKPAENRGLGERISDLRTFFELSKKELKKVVWPDKKETMSTTGAVMILVVVISLFLGVMDLGLSKIIEAILS
ncbi:preprotein translocase subunit SecE [Desulfoplanes formicivorans]|uniref:Protein translocase subunit SecE n=1 Tax=Desulfoplanes formicivorans TaxID=1592317 RepID=A0A194AEC6_9BACT|nr:preprotein translocase subunit SecE [Desulfoplanes formicivorans]GAU07555.1 preprotein translocase subunit SecE [Desulfoplanes formicivorans]